MIRTLKTLLLAFLVAVGLALSVVQPAAAAAAPAQITLNPASGPVGTAVTVAGTGFKASTTGTVIVGSTTFPFQTTATGGFSTGITIPAGSAGNLTITAKTSSIKASAVFVVQAAPSPQPPTVSTAALRFGVATAGGPLASSELDEVSTLAGESPSIIMIYKDFLQSPPIIEMDAARTRGATPLVTWEPWAWGGGVDQPAYSLDRITAGDFDGLITQWGTSFAAWGKPVMLRFAHEMNGNWYPWAEGVNGNQAGDYAAAWRHVHDVLAATGASNVQWVWSPNVPYWGSTDLAGLFPGAAYADIVALDGYNWGTSQTWSSWVSPADLFAPGISQLRALAPGKPILVAETASSELGGSKATWNTDLVSYLAAQPDVMGFVWFHLQKEVDWRINSSDSSASAFRSALLARRS